MLFSGDFDDVNAELRLNQITDGSDAKAERYTFELRHHLAAAEVAEISAGFGGRILGELFRKAAEVLALFRAFEHLTGLILDLFNFLGCLLLSFKENVLRFHAFWNRVLRSVLLVILAKFVVGYSHL